jgi:hypothetical protein
MALVGIALNVESPGQDLLPRSRRVVPLGVPPQRRRTGIDLDVFGTGGNVDENAVTCMSSRVDTATARGTSCELGSRP